MIWSFKKNYKKDNEWKVEETLEEMQNVIFLMQILTLDCELPTL